MAERMKPQQPIHQPDWKRRADEPDPHKFMDEEQRKRSLHTTAPAVTVSTRMNILRDSSGRPVRAGAAAVKVNKGAKYGRT